MKIREVMTPDPVCCVPGDTAQSVAKIMCEHNVGSIPVVVDQQSRKLTGIITDRDLCCSIIAKGSAIYAAEPSGLPGRRESGRL